MSKNAKVYATGEWTKIRKVVLSRDGYICAYCGQDANSVDHVVAIASGGEPFSLDNLVACCKRCNSVKRDRSTFFLRQSLTPPVLSNHLSLSTTASTPSEPIVTINDPA